MLTIAPSIAPSNSESVEEQSKKYEVEKVLRVAEYDASKPSIIIWGVLGFVLTVIGVLIVYVRSPKIGTSAIFRYGNSGNLLQIYEIHYTTTLKQRQIKATWIGLLAWVAIYVFGAVLGTAHAEGLRVPAEVVRVYDGDTFTADARPWPGVTIRVSVRLKGVDTPEIRGRCQMEKQLAIDARERLKGLFSDAGNLVFLEHMERGKYSGRMIARVTVPSGHDVSETMIRLGYGRAYDGGKRQGWCLKMKDDRREE